LFSWNRPVWTTAGRYAAVVAQGFGCARFRRSLGCWRDRSYYKVTPFTNCPHESASKYSCLLVAVQSIQIGKVALAVDVTHAAAFRDIRSCSTFGLPPSTAGSSNSISRNSFALFVDGVRYPFTVAVVIFCCRTIVGRCFAM